MVLFSKRGLVAEAMPLVLHAAVAATPRLRRSTERADRPHHMAVVNATVLGTT
jgi:hypothetical protein